MLATGQPYWLENGAGHQDVQTVDDEPVSEVIQGTLFGIDDLGRLEAERRRILAEGPVAPKGSWIEAYTARRRRKSGKVVDYTYYRFRYSGAKPGEPTHRSLGRYGSRKYLEAQAAIWRRKRLEKTAKKVF